MASQVLQDCLYRPLSDPSPSPVTADSQAASVASQVPQDCLYRPLSDPSPLSCDSGLSGGPRWPVRSSRTVCTRPLSDPSPPLL